MVQQNDKPKLQLSSQMERQFCLFKALANWISSHPMLTNEDAEEVYPIIEMYTEIYKQIEEEKE